MSMRNKGRKFVMLVFSSLAICGLITVSVLAAAKFDIGWYTLGSGGGKIASEVYMLNSTIGQASVGGIAGGQFRLGSGYWGDIEPVSGSTESRIHLPMILR